MTEDSVSEMVEKVARAICRAHCLGDPGKMFLDANWPRHVDAARAAIAAMREPTGQMLFEGVIAQEGDDPAVQCIYTAMIDAALHSGREG